MEGTLPLPFSVSEKQLRFLAPAKPLSTRFGAAYFKAAPKAPGVYRMLDERDKIIYVGQSKNLRQRLNSYRQVHPDRSSRKLVRLVHAVARIEWEECETAAAAKLRENHLIREHRPKFNSANVWPKAHCFIGMQWAETQLEFSYTRALPDQAATFYGAFKSGCLPGYAAVLRLLWTTWHQITSPQDLPRQLLADKPSRQFVFDLSVRSSVWCPNEKRELLLQFFSGDSPTLLEALRLRLPGEESLSLFHRNYIAADFEKAGEFFLRGPLRNRELKHKHELDAPLIGQEALDDLTIRA